MTFPAGIVKGDSAMDREEAAFSNQQSAISQNENHEQQQRQKQQQRQQPKRFTTEDTESTERVKQRAEALLKKIGEACDELERLAEDNPELVGRVTYGAEEHKEAYLRLKARLALADQAPRCRWVRQDGTTCGSPQMKKHIYCFAHAQMMEAQALALRLPAMEDANAIQIGIMRIQKALIEGAISTKMAGLLLYSMQLGMTNVGGTTFGQAKAGELVTNPVSMEQAVREDLGIAPSARRDSEPFTTEDTEGTEKSKSSPLMNADGADLEEFEEEFVPLPGGAGYRFTRLRIDGRQASAGPAAGPPRAAAPQEHGDAMEQAEPLTKGPQFQPQHAQRARVSGSPVARELLEASTQGSALQAEPCANLG